MSGLVGFSALPPPSDDITTALARRREARASATRASSTRHHIWRRLIESEEPRGFAGKGPGQRRSGLFFRPGCEKGGHTINPRNHWGKSVGAGGGPGEMGPEAEGAGVFPTGAPPRAASAWARWTELRTGTIATPPSGGPGKCSQGAPSQIYPPQFLFVDGRRDQNS